MLVHIQDLLLVDRLEQRKADTLRANLTFGVEVWRNYCHAFSHATSGFIGLVLVNHRPEHDLNPFQILR